MVHFTNQLKGTIGTNYVTSIIDGSLHNLKVEICIFPDVLHSFVYCSEVWAQISYLFVNLNNSIYFSCL